MESYPLYEKDNDWLDSSKMGSNGPNTIMNGVEYNVLGKIVAYWLWDQHPGEQFQWKDQATTSRARESHMRAV
jgi:capsid protein